MARKSNNIITEISPSFGGLDNMQANNVATGINWKGMVPRLATEAGRNEVTKAITEYLSDIRKAANDPHGGYAIKSTRTGHITGLPAPADLDLSFYGPAVDHGVMQFFTPVDKRSSMNPTYQFANLSAQAIVFEQKEEGQPIRVRQVSGGSPVSVNSITYHGALGIDDDAKRFDNYGVFEQNVQRVPARYDAKMAAVFHALIEAMSGITETWVTDLITTINNAGATIIEACAEKYELGDSPTLGLYYNHRNWMDVQQALASNFTVPNSNNSAKKLQWNIVPIKTRRLAKDNFKLGLPGYSNVDVTWDDLWSEYGRDHTRGVDDFVYRARRAGGIGDTAQWRDFTKV